MRIIDTVNRLWQNGNLEVGALLPDKLLDDNAAIAYRVRTNPCPHVIRNQYNHSNSDLSVARLMTDV